MFYTTTSFSLWSFYLVVRVHTVPVPVQILLRHGGLYVDVDFLCLASFEPLHRRYDFYTGLSNTGTFELNNGLVG